MLQTWGTSESIFLRIFLKLFLEWVPSDIMHTLWFATWAPGQSRVPVVGAGDRPCLPPSDWRMPLRNTARAQWIAFLPFPRNPRHFLLLNNPAELPVYVLPHLDRKSTEKGLSQLNSNPRVHLCSSRLHILIDLIILTTWIDLHSRTILHL